MTQVHPERFDPPGQGGKLIDSEHRGRYWWAARVVADKDVLDVACGTGYGTEILAAGAARVTGVDASADAVEAAERRLDRSATVLLGDLRALPLPDDSFDVAVCWETIEHMAEGERALAELRRVLRPDGLLLISSPNPRTYPPGNEHHVHEYPPEELADAVGEHFSHVASYGQHALLASAIESVNGTGAHRLPTDSSGRLREVRATLDRDPGGETYGIVVASDGEIPKLDDLLVLGDAFEVRWWSERVARARSEGDAFAERLRKTSAALLDANQSLAQIPLLEHRIEERREENVWLVGERTRLEEENERLRGEGAQLREEVGALRARVEVVEGSRSWRLLAPLRHLRQMLRR